MQDNQVVTGKMSLKSLKLKGGFAFNELLIAEHLLKLDQLFLAYLKEINRELHDELLSYRLRSDHQMTPALSEFIIHLAKILESFLSDFFSIEEELAISQAKTISHNPISQFKKYYLLRRAKKELSKTTTLPSFLELTDWLNQKLQSAALQTKDLELAIALFGIELLTNPEKNKSDIDQLVAWCTQSLATTEGQLFTKDFKSFQLPERLDYQHLVPTESISNDPINRLKQADEKLRLRDGFALTDPRMTQRAVQDEINYCIYCHDHEGDFCSRGFPEKKGDPSKGFKKNPLDSILTGCPLDEKISEMHALKKDGHTLASLAVVMIDNPLCPATGHRICNECMKACIYQKQEPVNIPQIETRVLTDVLALPWGVEIYDLLTKWNPLRQKQWVMKPYNGLKVMIAGMGPSGFTLAHHLLMEGFAVVGVDGLKIENIDEALINNPIMQYKTLTENLDTRLMAGFGGVAEYGITVRWDKNFLKLIYLSLMRRRYFQVFGSVRFGGTIQVEDAFAMGFDHFVVAVGAGLPKALPIPNSLSPGMRQANDFLMALQLGSAAKLESLTNLQIRMPAVVIGGGLTGVDTATELQAYYITQVEKILNRYQQLEKAYGEHHLRQQFDENAWEILQEYIRHGKEVRDERQRATENNIPVNLIHLIHRWGGVTIVYRRTMQESPAYINNHEELKKAFEEGIYYAENLEPVALDIDAYGQSNALICHQRIRKEGVWLIIKEDIKIPARSILVATGTQPNIAYEFEHRGTFNRLNVQYQHYEEVDGELVVAKGAEHCKEKDFGPFTSYHKNDYRVSLIGDTHPAFHGSVVKAIASGMKTYPKILKSLAHKLGNIGDDNEYQQFAKTMQEQFQAKVLAIKQKTKDIFELTIHAPQAVKHFRPGQFYRLQNYEKDAALIQNTRLTMEPLAVVAASCDKEKNHLHFLIETSTPSAKIAAHLKVNQSVALMGPTGVRAKIPVNGESVLIIGHPRSIAFLLSYGKDLRKENNKILYLLKYTNDEDIYCRDELMQIANSIIWLSSQEHTHDHPEPSSCHPERSEGTPASCDIANSLILKGTRIENALLNYIKHNPEIPLEDIDRIFVVGNTPLLREFQHLRKNGLKKYLIKNPKVYGSVYGNMQCMLKGVCAQCLQWQIDPETGARTKAVFACSWQDQPLEMIDFDHMDQRAMQNQVHEKLSNLWLDYVLRKD